MKRKFLLVDGSGLVIRRSSKKKRRVEETYLSIVQVDKEIFKSYRAGDFVRYDELRQVVKPAVFVCK